MSCEARARGSGEVLSMCESTFFSLLLHRTREARALCGFQHYKGENPFCFLFSDPIIVGLRLIIRRIPFRASDFGVVAKINLIRAKSQLTSCAEMVLGSFVFLLV